MKNVLLVLLNLACVSIAYLGCSDDNGGNGGSGNSVWDGTINGQTAQFLISSQAASTQADGGVLLSVGGNSSLGDLIGSIDVAGGTPIDLTAPDETTPPSATIQVGATGVTVSITVEGIRYFGTSGSVTFTAYGPNIGESVEGSLDVGFVSVGQQTTQGSATLSGTFSSIVAAPVPTPTPTP